MFASALDWNPGIQAMEEVDSISVAVSNIDINKVEPLENRRVVAFLNHFLCTTVTFLNQFAVKCEYKLDQIQQKLFKIESALRILESKLESLPEAQLPNAIPRNITEESSSIPQSPKPNSVKTEITNADVTADPTASDSNANFMTSPENSSSSQKPPNLSGKETDTKETSDEDHGEKPAKENHRQDPRYEKYFKMMYVGVPVPAIKQKMSSEGVNPSILDS